MLVCVFYCSGVSLLKLRRCRVYGDSRFLKDVSHAMEKLKRCDPTLYNDVTENSMCYWFVSLQDIKVRPLLSS